MPPKARRARHPAGSKPKQVKLKKPRPEWDSSISNLDGLRMTPAEKERKREAILAANAERARALQRQRQRVFEALSRQEAEEAARAASAPRQMNKSANNRHMSKLMREVLHGDDHEVLQHALRGESGTLDILEELFGGDAMKFKSEPAVTTAPENHSTDSSSDNANVDESELLVWAKPPPRKLQEARRNPDTTIDSTVSNGHNQTARTIVVESSGAVERKSTNMEQEQQRRVLVQAAKMSPMKIIDDARGSMHGLSDVESNDSSLSNVSQPRKEPPHPSLRVQKRPPSPPSEPDSLNSTKAGAQHSKQIAPATATAQQDKLHTLGLTVTSIEDRLAKLETPSGPNPHLSKPSTSQPSFSGYMERLLLVVDRLMEHIAMRDKREKDRKISDSEIVRRLDSMQASVEMLQKENKALQQELKRLSQTNTDINKSKSVVIPQQPSVQHIPITLSTKKGRSFTQASTGHSYSNRESPLKAAVESASAATGLSVQELLGDLPKEVRPTQPYALNGFGQDALGYGQFSGYSTLPSQSWNHPRETPLASDPLVHAAEVAFQQDFFPRG